MSNSKKTNSTKVNSTKTSRTKTNSTKVNNLKMNSTKTNSKKMNNLKVNSTKTDSKKMNNLKTNSTKTNSKDIKKSIGEVIEISLMLVAFGIIVEILSGGILPLGSGIMMKLMGLLSTLGDNGLVGIMVLGIVIYIFRKGKVFA